MTIKELREEKNLSQTAFAKSIGVSSSTVGAIETGSRKVSPAVAEAIEKVYGVAVDNGGEEPVKAAAKPVKKAKAAAKTSAKKAEKVEVKPVTEAVAEEVKAEAAEKAEEAPAPAKEKKAPAAKKKAPAKKAEKVEKKAAPAAEPAEKAAPEAKDLFTAIAEAWQPTVQKAMDWADKNAPGLKELVENVTKSAVKKIKQKVNRYLKW